MRSLVVFITSWSGAKRLVLITEWQNGRGWKGPLGVTQPNPLPKQGHPEQAAQDLVQAGLEYLQRRRLHNLPGQPGPGLRHPQREEVLPHVQLELPLLQFVIHIPNRDILLTANRQIKKTQGNLEDWQDSKKPTACFHASRCPKRFVFSRRQAKRANLTAFPTPQHHAPKHCYCWRGERMQNIGVNAAFQLVLCSPQRPHSAHVECSNPGDRRFPLGKRNTTAHGRVCTHHRRSALTISACCRWPCFGRGVGLDDPQRSLPTPTILWFCEITSNSGWRLWSERPKTSPFHKLSLQCSGACESFPPGRSQSPVSDGSPSTGFSISFTLL